MKGTSQGWVTQSTEFFSSNPDDSSEEVTRGAVLQVQTDPKGGTDERSERLLTALDLEQGDLTEQQFQELKTVIVQNADVFALKDSELGCTNVVQHEIYTGDHPPIKQPIRRMPFVYREKVSNMVEDMLRQGDIQPSASPWASPIVLVPKKDGSY